VTTKGLAQHYDKLTPRERVPLILAASARGDQQERDRLMNSAPRVHYPVPDHFGLAMAFLEVSGQHFMGLLDLVANYFEVLGHAEGWEDAAGKRMLDVALMLGYLLKVRLAGWRLFCAEHCLDPEVCWSVLPGWETLQRGVRTAEKVAFTEEGAARYAERRGWDAVQVPTAEGVAARLRQCLKEQEEWWG
jgi:hypothetical protein